MSRLKQDRLAYLNGLIAKYQIELGIAIPYSELKPEVADGKGRTMRVYTKKDKNWNRTSFRITVSPYLLKNPSVSDEYLITTLGHEISHVFYSDYLMQNLITNDIVKNKVSEDDKVAARIVSMLFEARADIGGKYLVDHALKWQDLDTEMAHQLTDKGEESSYLNGYFCRNNRIKIVDDYSDYNAKALNDIFLKAIEISKKYSNVNLTKQKVIEYAINRCESENEDLHLRRLYWVRDLFNL